jgi:3-hydroxyisobutyrate dehydrogenase-like beta-hydroxyacid dehydrogenase
MTNPTVSKPSVGIIGFGLVGQALATRLTALDYRVHAFDIDAEKLAVATALQVQWCACAQAVFSIANVVLICVLDDSALIATAKGYAVKQSSCSFVVSCVTASQRATLSAAEHFKHAGTSFVDMPLLGSSAQIRSGNAIGLLGADSATFTQWHKMLTDIAPGVRHVGPLGQGVAAKIACNLVLGLNRSALAEGMALAESMGIAPTLFLGLLQDSPAYSKAVDNAGPRMAANDFSPISRVRQHRKDLQLMIDAAQGAGIPTYLLRAQIELLDQAILQGLGDSDNVSVIQVYRAPKHKNLSGEKNAKNR